MTTTYRYMLQKLPDRVFIADVSVTDPPAALAADNHAAMVKIQNAGLSFMEPWHDGLVGIKWFEYVSDDAVPPHGSFPVELGANMTQAHADTLLQMFKDNIRTSLPLSHPGHGHK